MYNNQYFIFFRSFAYRKVAVYTTVTAFDNMPIYIHVATRSKGYFQSIILSIFVVIVTPKQRQ